MTNGWRDQLAGARMQVDQQFNDRVQNSQFTNQEWGLIMTAVEFEITDPETPDSAEMTVNTENLDQIMPELDNLPQGMGGVPGGESGSAGGILGSIKGALGLSDSSADGTDKADLEAATALVEEYATELEAHLKEQERWEKICGAAAKHET